jgi:hypothetical protein
MPDPDGVFDRVTKPLWDGLKLLETKLLEKNLSSDDLREWGRAKQQIVQNMYTRMGQRHGSCVHPASCVTKFIEGSLRPTEQETEVKLKVNVESAEQTTQSLVDNVTIPSLRVTDDISVTPSGDEYVSQGINEADARKYESMLGKIRDTIQHLNDLAMAPDTNPDSDKFISIPHLTSKRLARSMLDEFSTHARKTGATKLELQIDGGGVKIDGESFVVETLLSKKAKKFPFGALQYRIKAMVNEKSVLSQWYTGQDAKKQPGQDVWELNKTLTEMGNLRTKRRQERKKRRETSHEQGENPSSGAGIAPVSSPRDAMPPPAKRVLGDSMWSVSASAVALSAIDLKLFHRSQGALAFFESVLTGDSKAQMAKIIEHFENFEEQFNTPPPAQGSELVNWSSFDRGIGALHMIVTTNSVPADKLYGVQTCLEQLGQFKDNFRSGASVLGSGSVGGASVVSSSHGADPHYLRQGEGENAHSFGGGSRTSDTFLRNILN